MRRVGGNTRGGALYVASVIALGAAVVPVALAYFPIRPNALLPLLYLGLFTQLAALMPIKWHHGKQTVDTTPLVAAALLCPGVGPALLAWLCRNDGTWPSAEVPLNRFLFNRARTAIEYGVPSMAIALVPFPAEIEVPAKTLVLAAASLIIGYPLTAQAIATHEGKAEGKSLWAILSANVGISSIRSVFILGIGGGALFMVLELPGGWAMGLGLLGLLFAVRSNMADAQRQQEERIQTLELMAQALDARDPMTELHSQRVSNLAAQIAQALGLNSLEVERLRVAGLLHDIGKIGVPDAVLKKPAGLDPAEWAAMRRHAEVGAEMIGRHTALRPMAPWVRYHHERWNGSGYPSGLAGDEIPLGARIIAVADSFDTITGPRVYRRTSMTPAEAVADISAASSILYDPEVVNALRRVFGDPPLTAISAAAPEIRTLAPPSPVSLLKRHSMLSYLAGGVTLSSIGDPLTAIAVAVSAFTVTHNGVGVAAAVGLRAAAMMVAGLLLGGAVDRLPRRVVVAVCDSIGAATLLATPFLLVFAPWTLFGIVVILGAAAALGQAGRDASVAYVMRGRHIGVANGILATGSTVGRSVGYPLAAIMVWWLASTSPLYLIDAVTFILAAGLTLLAGPLGGGIKSRSVLGALRGAFTVRAARVPLFLSGAGAFALSMTVPALVVIAYELSQNGPRAYTFLEVTLTAGMVIGALIFSRLSANARLISLVGLVAMGALCLVTAASSFLLVTAAILFAASIGNQLYFIGNRTELQELAPIDRVGSVMATRGVLAQSLAIAGSATGGVLTLVVGGRSVYLLAGSVMLLIGAAALLVGGRVDRQLKPVRHADESVIATRAVKSHIEMAEGA